MSRLVVPLFPLLLAASLSAQALVSPAGAATSEGNYDNSLPFGYGGTQQAYLQLHADLAGRAGTFNRLAVRRDGVYATNPGLTAKTVRASLWFGQGVAIANMSSTFANNFVGAKTRVCNDRTFSMPDWTQRPQPAPAPFDVLIPLDAPFVWTGPGTFAWEMRVHDMSSTHAMFADAVRSSDSASSSGSTFGTPCPMTGGSIFATSLFSSSSAWGHSLSWSMTTPRRGVPALLWIGTQVVNVPLPGLCRPVLADPAVVVPGATRTTDGGYDAQAFVPSYSPWLVGLRLLAQGAVADAGRADAIPFALSAGMDNTIPGVPPPPVARLYHASDDTALSGFRDPSGTWLGSVLRLD